MQIVTFSRKNTVKRERILTGGLGCSIYIGLHVHQKIFKPNKIFASDLDLEIWISLGINTNFVKLTFFILSVMLSAVILSVMQE